MKKVLTLMLVLLLTLSLLTSCGSGGGSGTPNSAPGNSSNSSNSNNSSNSSNSNNSSNSSNSNNSNAPPASDSGGSDNSTSESNTSAQQGDDFIRSSQLIPLEDAKRIVHESLEIGIDSKTGELDLDKPERPLPGFTTTYTGDVFLVLVVTVHYNESYIAGIKRDIDAGLFAFEEVDGLGEWAAFIEIIGKSLYIGYKDIFLNISIAGLKSVSIADEDRDGIFMELGRLACANYDALK